MPYDQPGHLVHPLPGGIVTQYGSVSEWDNGTSPPTNPVRSPPRWNPFNFTVEDSATLDGPARWQQVLGPRPGRKQWTVVNTGANGCKLSNQQAPQGDVGVTVGAGGAWTEDVEDEVWVLCIGGTTLDVTETYTPLYDAVGGARTPGGQVPYIAPLLPAD